MSSVEPRPSRIKSFAQSAFRNLVPLVILVVSVFSLRSAVADWYDVPTGSMLPTILEGDRIVVNKLAYDLRFPFTDAVLARWGTPTRGDIVTLSSPRDGIRLVKRVCAVAGDTVEMRDGRLFVNERSAHYRPIDIKPYLRDLPEEMRGARAFAEEVEGAEHLVLRMPWGGAYRDLEPIEVPEGFVLVMGDNRDRSSDSRAFGLVPVKSVKGKMVSVAFSVDTEEGLRVRGNRFLHRPDSIREDAGDADLDS